MTPDYRAWLPIRTVWRPAGLLVEWCHVGREPLRDPFLEQTVQRHMAHPFNLLFRHQTPMSWLGELAAQQPGLAPSGFIFHLSRCGSTLVSELARALPATLVLSEPAALTGLLQTPVRAPAVSAAEQQTWLRWLISALGQPRAGDERHYVIKFDSWHTLALPLICQAFPEVPCMFLYRDPVEVLVSNLREIGARMLPGPLEAAELGLDLAAAFALPPEHYMAVVLGRLCAAALAAAEQGLALVNYSELPGALDPWLLDYLHLPAAGRAALPLVARRNAKHPSAAFVPDGAAKQQAATAEVRAAVAQWAQPAYEQLELLRLQQRRS